jgi:hypothetical protein
MSLILHDFSRYDQVSALSAADREIGRSPGMYAAGLHTLDGLQS